MNKLEIVANMLAEKRYAVVIRASGELVACAPPAKGKKYGLAELQAMVGGSIEHPYAPRLERRLRARLWCDEEGKLKIGATQNVVATRFWQELDGPHGDVLVGDVALVPSGL